jgi:voltage-gated potassium channel
MASGRNSPLLARIADWLVWLAFLAETMLLSALVRNKRAYLRGSWMNLIIVVGGMLLLWQFMPLVGLLRSFRLVLVVMTLARLSNLSACCFLAINWVTRWL